MERDDSDEHHSEVWSGIAKRNLYENHESEPTRFSLVSNPVQNLTFASAIPITK